MHSVLMKQRNNVKWAVQLTRSVTKLLLLRTNWLSGSNKITEKNLALTEKIGVNINQNFSVILTINVTFNYSALSADSEVEIAPL